MGRESRDLTNAEFGMLKVEGRAARPANRRDNCSFWRCRCECGKVVVVARSNLVAGHTRSCGCSRRAKADLSGQTHGKLYVMERAPRPEAETGYQRNLYNWFRCRCKCGRVVVLPAEYITSGSNASCGCAKRVIKPHQRRIGKGIMPTVEADLERRRNEREKGPPPMQNARKCECCGKTFDCYARDRWGWKLRRNNRLLIFCTWKCQRAWEKENPMRGTPERW